MTGCFITGTGTGVGKTYLTALWTRTLRSQGTPALALKPFLCGEERTDAEIFAKANEETLSLNQINPLWLRPPLAPFTASVVENKPLDLEKVRESLTEVTARFGGPFLIEGIGGWMVPLTSSFYIRDFARELKLPVLVVASAGLGTINHTLLTVESIRTAGCSIPGILLNQPSNDKEDMASATNPSVIAELTGLPTAVIPANATPEDLPSWLPSGKALKSTGVS